MKILILGGDGMLGHQLLQSLQKSHSVCVTLRQNSSAYQKYRLFNLENSYFGIDVRRDQDLISVIADFQPDAVINAVGIVKQRHLAKEAIPSIEINALFPHRLAQICKLANARMIHISTDCIFSGKKGNYVETDPHDALDLYGISKYMGEVHDQHCVTIRSSIIGLELANKAGLIEWFLAQQGTIKGFQRAIYSGLTTQEMSHVIENILLNHPTLSGVWHVSSDFISKYDLLVNLQSYLDKKDIKIEKDDSFYCDRSLNGSRFYQATQYKIPTWDEMLKNLANQIKKRENKRELECAI